MIDWKGMGSGDFSASTQACAHLLRMILAGFPVTDFDTTVSPSPYSTRTSFWNC